MKPPRRRGSTLAVISVIAVTIRAELVAIRNAAAVAAPPMPTAGRWVRMSIPRADSGTTPRNTASPPKRSTRRPARGVVARVRSPPATNTTGSCDCVTPTLATKEVEMNGITENAPTISSEIMA